MNKVADEILKSGGHDAFRELLQIYGNVDTFLGRWGDIDELEMTHPDVVSQYDLMLDVLVNMKELSDNAERILKNLWYL